MNSKEYKKEYRLKNKAAIKVGMDKYRAENKDKIKEARKRYVANNQQFVKERSRVSFLKVKAKNLEEYPLKLLVINTKCRARRRKQSFEISHEFVEALWVKQEGKCYYTGISMELSYAKKSPYQVSIDRRDSTIGYTEDNSILCCLSINYAKNSFTEQQLIDFLGSLK